MVIPSENAVPPTGSSPFVFLDETHRQSQRMFDRLCAFANKLHAKGEVTVLTLQESRELNAWFDRIWREHHIDEETYVFPRLLDSDNAELVSQTRQLIQEHVWFEESWIAIKRLMTAAISTKSQLDAQEFLYAVDLFAQLYADHLQLEQQVIYPAASALIKEDSAKEFGREMAQRFAQRAPSNKIKVGQLRTHITSSTSQMAS